MHHRDYNAGNYNAGNAGLRGNVYPIVKRRLSILVAMAAALGAAYAYDYYTSARQKIDSIEAGRLKAGTRVTLTFRELEAWVTREMPDGVRDPRLRVNAAEIAIGSAIINFGKVQRGRGEKPGWLMSKLLDGERPVSVTARIRSSGGRATVDVQRVEISGLAIDGATLDFLIRNVLLPAYPNAVVGRPFELGDRIEKLDVQPAGVGVVIGN